MAKLATTGSSHAGPVGEAILALIVPIIVKLEDHDIRAPIFGMGRVVAISRDIRILVITTTNRHDLPRTAGWLRFSIWSTA